MADPTTQANGAATSGAKPDAHTFPDPSITLIEFGDAFSVLIAARTEPESANRRLVLKKVAYVRLEGEGWGAAAFPELWVQQNAAGLFVVIDAASGKIFHDPSRLRYEIGFMSQEIFDCTIQCLKDRKPAAIYELAVVTFAKRKGFSVEQGGLLAPDDYASERGAVSEDQYVPLPPRQKTPAGA